MGFSAKIDKLVNGSTIQHVIVTAYQHFFYDKYENAALFCDINIRFDILKTRNQALFMTKNRIH